MEKVYRIQRSLGNNAVLALQSDSNKKYLIIGKGIGFGRKVTERIQIGPEDTAYCLQDEKAKVNMEKIAKTVSPEFLELSDYVLKEAEKKLGSIDKNILFSMADHIAFAIERLKRGETIHNPMLHDIKVLFHQEFKIAAMIEPVIFEKYNLRVNEDEIGYVTLHIHSALTDESVSEAAILAQAVRMCVKTIEKCSGCTLDTMSISYNRLVNHIRYMMIRANSGKQLEIDMNAYMKESNNECFKLSQKICEDIEENYKCKLGPAEIGYLAIHIQRIKMDLKK